jgi:hypothetical protein
VGMGRSETANALFSENVAPIGVGAGPPRLIVDLYQILVYPAAAGRSEMVSAPFKESVARIMVGAELRRIIAVAEACVWDLLSRTEPTAHLLPTGYFLKTNELKEQAGGHVEGGLDEIMTSSGSSMTSSGSSMRYPMGIGSPIIIICILDKLCT